MLVGKNILTYLDLTLLVGLSERQTRQVVPVLEMEPVGPGGLPV